MTVAPVPSGSRLARVRVQRDGLLLRPWFRPSRLVPWTRIKGVRIAPLRRWPGPGGAPGGRSFYAVQVRLDGEWRQVGRTQRVHHSIWPADVREFFLGPQRRLTLAERILLQGYEFLRSAWEQGGGTPGDEDDNWPRG
jgi:hypothetical protein